MTGFIEEHRGRFGVEPVCRVMEFNPSTYWAARGRPPSERAVRDEALKPEVERVHKENYGVHGAHKVWKQMNREGFTVARCTVARLMRDLGASRRAPRQEVSHDGTRRERCAPGRPGVPPVRRRPA